MVFYIIFVEKNPNTLKKQILKLTRPTEVEPVRHLLSDAQTNSLIDFRKSIFCTASTSDVQCMMIFIFKSVLRIKAWLGKHIKGYCMATIWRWQWRNFIDWQRQSAVATSRMSNMRIIYNPHKTHTHRFGKCCCIFTCHTSIIDAIPADTKPGGIDRRDECERVVGSLRSP